MKIFRITLFLFAVIAGQLSAQTLGPLKITASWRGRAEVTDWFDQSDRGEYPFGASVLRFSIGQDYERMIWNLEAEQPTLFNLPGDAILPAPKGQLGLGGSYFAANNETTTAGLLVKQGFLRFKNVGASTNSVQLGRFEFIDGAEIAPADAILQSLKKDRIAHRLIGNFGFSHVGRSFDGGDFVYGTKTNNFTAFAGRPTQGVFSVHGMAEVDADVEYAAYTREFTAKSHPSEARIFFLDYHDARSVLKTDNRSTAARTADKQDIRLHTIGGHYLYVQKTPLGAMDLLAWGAAQFGSWGVQTQRAGSYAFEAGFQPKALPRLKPWIRIGYDASTGDGNATDGEHNTFFQMLPTPRIYARFPFYNLMNTEDVFSELILRPHKRVAVRTDFHHIQLSNGHDLWYGGGGAYDNVAFGFTGRPANGTTNLGNLFDASTDVTVTKHWSVTGYYAHVFAGSVVQKIYGTNAMANYGYVELNWKL